MSGVAKFPKAAAKTGGQPRAVMQLTGRRSL